MIQKLTGTVESLTTTSINLGVGPMVLELFVPEVNAFQKGIQVSVSVYLHWNQEQGPSLYGFKDNTEKDIFGLILTCSGIGPRLALAILGQLGAMQFVEAVHMNNPDQLCVVSGIGLKKAEQIIVQLKHKIGALLKTGFVIQSSSVAHWQTIEQALQALSYSRMEINHALDYLKTKKDEGYTFDQLMRFALSHLSKQS